MYSQVTPLNTLNGADVVSARRIARIQALRMGLTSTEAEDVEQMVSIFLFERWEQIENPDGWAYTVGRRIAMKVIRRRLILAETTDYNQSSGSFGPDSYMDLKRAFGGLSEEARHILWSRNVDGAEWERIARIHGSSSATVKRRYRRVTAMLRRRAAA
jgi:DNA-directed RNA polymerase specialized sigma24 family protein